MIRPENDYELPSYPPTALNRSTLNSIFMSIGSRLRRVESTKADFDSLIEQGTQASLDYIQVTVGPRLGLLQQDIADARAAIEDILGTGTAPNAERLGGQLPTYYAPASHSHNTEQIEGLDNLIDTRISDVIGSAAEGLDTLGKLGSALDNDVNFAATVNGKIDEKVPKSGGVMTGFLRWFYASADPKTLANGDFWMRTTGIFARIAGATHKIITNVGNQSIAGNLTLTNNGRFIGDGSQLTGLAFSKAPYISPEITVSLGGTTTLTHGLDGKPKLITAKFKCVVAEHGYSVGHEIPYPMSPFFLYTNQSYCTGVQAYLPNNTQIGIIAGWSSLPAVYVRTTGTQAYITAANWRLVVEAYE